MGHFNETFFVILKNKKLIQKTGIRIFFHPTESRHGSWQVVIQITLMAVCSTPSPSQPLPVGLVEETAPLAAAAAATLLKLRLILEMQRSAGSNRLR
jgi:hypothetical protein